MFTLPEQDLQISYPLFCLNGLASVRKLTERTLHISSFSKDQYGRPVSGKISNSLSTFALKSPLDRIFRRTDSGHFVSHKLAKAIDLFFAREHPSMHLNSSVASTFANSSISLSSIAQTALHPCLQLAHNAHCCSTLMVRTPPFEGTS